MRYEIQFREFWKKLELVWQPLLTSKNLAAKWHLWENFVPSFWHESVHFSCSFGVSGAWTRGSFEMSFVYWWIPQPLSQSLWQDFQNTTRNLTFEGYLTTIFFYLWNHHLCIREPPAVANWNLKFYKKIGNNRTKTAEKERTKTKKEKSIIWEIYSEASLRIAPLRGASGIEMVSFG